MKLDHAIVDIRLAEMPGWTRRDDAIVRELKFPAFADAIAFVTRLAFDAEAKDHHPDLLVSYRRVTVTWTTHDEGGITERDLAGARDTDRIAARFLRSDADAASRPLDRPGD